MAANVTNDLYDYGYKIVQNPEYFKFSQDSILLADFVNINYTDKKLLDLCTGNAPIPIILSSKIEEINCMEIQTEVYDLAKQSIEINDIKNIHIINEDIKNWKNHFPQNSFDIVTANPPYFKYDENSNINDNRIKSIARHEITINLSELVKIASSLLKNRGRFYIVYRTERFIELLDELKKNNLGIKRIEFCYNDENSDCSTVLIESMKNGKDDVKVTKPIFTKNYRGE